MTEYRLSSQFILRITGFPLELLTPLRALDLSGAIDDLIDEREPERVIAARDRVGRLYEPELERVRRGLYDLVASERFRSALLLSSPGLESRSPLPGVPLPRRNSDQRHHEHSWISYVQRFTTKNDTISDFGPSVWGRIDAAEPTAAAITLSDPAIAERVVYVERWVCEALAERMSNGHVPVTAAPFEALEQAIAAWTDGAGRTTWSECLDSIEKCRAAIERSRDLTVRRQALSDLLRTLEECGISTVRSKRALHTARLPINEDCKRGVEKLVLGKPFIEQATGDLAPWYEMWRDLAGLYATRIGEKLAPIWHSLGSRPVPLTDFWRACSAAGIDFRKHAGAGMASEVDAEVQNAWQEQLGARMEQPEVELADDDMSFLRRRFRIERMKAFDNPAPDFQIAARDPAAIAEGRWQLVLGEIHPDLSIWEHCFLLWCPDVETLVREYRDVGHAPAVELGSPHEFVVHGFCRAHEFAGDWTFFEPLSATGADSVSAERALVDYAHGDLVVRNEEGRILGSLIHHWRVCGNTHRFELVGTGAHSPRLRVGRVIVQRESWLIRPDQDLRREISAIGPELLIALRRLRRRFELPEEVFVRPQLPIRLAYHKDTKPFFVDFRNPLLLEVLAGRLRKYLRVRFTEMLPSTEESWVSDGAGHYACELRMVAMPQEPRRP